MEFAGAAVKADYGKDSTKKSNIKNVRKYFDMVEKQEETLDEQTWNDLDMDNVYKKVDRTYSSVGEAVLYKMLRNPTKDEKVLKERDRVISYFDENARLRNKLSIMFYKLGRDRKNTFLDMIQDELVVNKAKYFVYSFLGKIMPIILILMAIFLGPQYIMGLLVLACINMLINNKEKDIVKSHGLLYLRDIINAANDVSSVRDEKIDFYLEKVRKSRKEIKSIDLATKSIQLANMWGGLLEFISVLFLLEESAYYKISDLLKNRKETFLNLYEDLGEIEALISIASYKKSIENRYTKPTFKKDSKLYIVDGRHPLLIDGVPNSVKMKKKGIVLTGTNMSGKSTFLRMIGINMIFAQTFYFAVAKKYEAPFFRIVTSINPNDNLSEGKSYYMSEAEALLRIINALNDEIPVFCAIDEIFRGTNPVERIAASAEILTYINERNAISIVTTHDRELVDILKDNYEFHYFSESVSKKNGLNFDYKLKDGVSKTKNAIKLLDFIGYPKEIIKKSFERAEKVDGFI